jgi:predicted metal-dependent enzyme (double-stranded beta helix superfamily)
MRSPELTRYVAIDRLVTDLKELAGRGFPVNEVSGYLAETLIEPSALAPYLCPSEEHYTRNLVHKDEDFEILVICWGSGQRAPIHGHEGELCFARVERGKLRFSNYRIVSEEPLVLEREATLDGTVGFLDGPADTHAVDNPKDFGEAAVSLHVYSRPYAECDIYESERGPIRRVKLAYDSIQGRPVERTRG